MMMIIMAPQQQQDDNNNKYLYYSLTFEGVEIFLDESKSFIMSNNKK